MDFFDFSLKMFVGAQPIILHREIPAAKTSHSKLVQDQRALSKKLKKKILYEGLMITQKTNDAVRFLVSEL